MLANAPVHAVSAGPALRSFHRSTDDPNRKYSVKQAKGSNVINQAAVFSLGTLSAPYDLNLCDCDGGTIPIGNAVSVSDSAQVPALPRRIRILVAFSLPCTNR